MSPRTLPFVALVLMVMACSGPAGRGDRPAAEYSPETGRLQRLSFDSDDDGRNDAVGIMDGARVNRIELDTTANGAIDRWDIYDDARRLIRVGLSRQDDGNMDAVTVYGLDGLPERVEVSTRRDGRFDRTEYYESDLLSRVEEDSDGDGRIDKWEAYQRNPRTGPGEAPSIVRSVAFDDDGAGRPTRRLVYGTDGALGRIERLRPDGTVASSAAAPQ